MPKAHTSSAEPASESITEKLLSRPYPFLILLLAVVVVYFPSLGFTLGKLDETNIILNNLDFLTNIRNLGKALVTNPFFNKGGDFYRPLQNVSFMLDAQLSGSAGWGYYLSNIIIHFLSCWMAYRLLILLNHSRNTAFLLTLLFAVHPLFVQTVAWAPSRGDLLLTLFSLLSISSFIRYIRSGTKSCLAVTMISFGLAMFSKETAIMIPLIAFLFYYNEKNRKISLRGLIPPVLGWLLIFGLFMFLRNTVAEIQVQKGLFGLLPLLVHLRTIPEFIAKFLLPLNLGPMPAFSLAFTAGGIVTLAIFIFLILKSSHKTELLTGLAWFLLFIIPAITYINKYGSAACDYMEHRAYLPLLGVLMILSRLLTDSEKLQKSRFSGIVLLLLIPVFGIFSFMYSENYRTPLAYYDRAVINNPASAIALFNRGTVRMDKEDNYQSAKEDFDKAIVLLPDYSDAYNNRGFCAEKNGDTTSAISDYSMAIRLKPGWTGPRINLASLKNSSGDTEGAIREYDTVLFHEPGQYRVYYERGKILMNTGNQQAAYEDLSQAIKLHENYPEAYFTRGMLLEQASEFSASLTDFNKAIEYRPDYKEAWVNRGTLKYRMQDFNGAIADFSQAISLDGNYTEAYLNRGMARFQIHDKEGACQDWTKAGNLNSADAASLLSAYCK